MDVPKNKAQMGQCEKITPKHFFTTTSQLRVTSNTKIYTTENSNIRTDELRYIFFQGNNAG